MSIPAPNLDDRRFQDLVDDAKRLVQRRCPEWSDHNVSDPGVTLIEAFASMVDQLLYRLNRVPDKHYLRFLDLIGVELFPSVTARADVTFWLSASQPDVVTVAAGSEVASGETEEPVVFSTETELEIIPCELAYVATQQAGGAITDRTAELVAETPFGCFDAAPAPGDTLYIGLSEPVPRCAVTLRLSCEIEGIGVDPTRPPLRWQAWDGSDWVHCEIDHDETGGLNRAGDVVLHVGPRHAASVLAGQRAGWLRCELTEPEEGQPFYSAAPRLHGASAFTVGGTIGAVHAEIARNEVVGVSDGTGGQRFRVARPPMAEPSDPEVLEVGGGQGWQRWQQVRDFTGSGQHDTHFTLDRGSGEVALGPAIRRPDGTLDQRGAVPPKGATLRLPTYHCGGGRRGNMRARGLSVLRSSIPYIARVENRRPAAGGVDGETVADARVRAPLTLRTRSRAVTAEDYEVLAREAAPGLARVRCIAGDVTGEDPDVVRVLVVPAADSDADGQVPFAALRPGEDLLRRVAGYLDERRTLGARVVVEPPFYRGVTVVVRLVAARRASPRLLRIDAAEALYRHLHPLTGGPDGSGWPFGRVIQIGEVHAVLQRLDGVEVVDTIRLYAADPVAGTRSEQPAERIEIGPGELVYSFEHQVLVV
ncbi:MAG: putative baseplate assembly protein [Pseudonocardiaceae bacterium]|nr:putative baseplate assembly protein [Pseudonocardiaceae bacterium]